MSHSSQPEGTEFQAKGLHGAQGSSTCGFSKEQKTIFFFSGESAGLQPSICNCHGPDVCVTSKYISWHPNPQCDVSIRRWAPWVGFGCEGGALINGRLVLL